MNLNHQPQLTEKINPVTLNPQNNQPKNSPSWDLVIATVNTIISKANYEFNKNSLSAPFIFIALNPAETTLTFYLNDQIESVLNFPCFTFHEVNEIILSLRKSHWMNTHLNIKFFDVYCPDAPWCEWNSHSLLVPTMLDTVNNVGKFFGRDISSDNYIIKSTDEYDLSLCFHNFAPISVFDVIVYNNREINPTWNKKLLESGAHSKSQLIGYFSECLLIDVIENGSRLKSKKYQINNWSMLILINAKPGRCRLETSEEVVHILKEVEGEWHEKLKYFVNNIIVELDFRSISTALCEVYERTNNEEWYLILNKLSTDGGNFVSDVTQLLYKDFITGGW